MGLRVVPQVILVLSLVFVACGAAPFGYKYYVLKPNSYQGTLEGADSAKDLPLSTCAPQNRPAAVPGALAVKVARMNAAQLVLMIFSIWILLDQVVTRLASA